MRRLFLALYPRKWRARHGDEFAALLEDTPLTVAAVIDVLCHAIGLHLKARPRRAQIAGVALATAAVEIMASRAGLTDNILWAPTTPLRTLALTAVLTPTALVAASAARRRIRRHEHEPV
jgi:hypothetical protein